MSHFSDVHMLSAQNRPGSFIHLRMNKCETFFSVISAFKEYFLKNPQDVLSNH